ncbi:Transcriptional repressor of the fructose operon, DeoR family [hydrothermal vent metagenome]|uniref:Transcriptional repressor of the fructose operon, DeoR family n=1 Tax=hydrothermal vent metagenome TaxID=652676 RepID=A0A3B1BJJ4_9ZZZZ
MIDAADKVYLLCDSSKIEQNSLFRMAPLSEIDYLITDAEVDKDIIEKYNESGIEIIIAESEY